MNATRRLMAVLLVLALLAAGVGAMAQTTAQEQFAADVADLLDLLDRALYLAMTGFSAYDHEDQLVAAQRLINLLEGPTGAEYATSVGETEGSGMLLNPALDPSYDWSGLAEQSSGSEIYVWRDAAVNTSRFLRLALDAALDARDTAYSLLGPEDAFRTAYACLVAARGGLEDPFLLAGIADLAELYPSSALTSEAVQVRENTLQDRLLGEPTGGVIQLDAGIYRDRVVITWDVTIQGRSPEETILEGVAWDAVLAVIAEEPVHLVLKDLTIRGGDSGVASWAYDEDASVNLTLDNVTLEENGIGVNASTRTSLDATECRFVHNELGLESKAPGSEILVRLTDCLFDGNDSALSVGGEQMIMLSACRILDGTDASGDIVIRGSARLEMRDCELHRMTGRGIVLAETASMTLIDSVIETAYAHAIAVASTSPDASGRVVQDCGISFGSSVGGGTDLPLGTISGYGNTITGGVCPVTLRFLTDPAPDEATVSAGRSIQTAIGSVADGGTVSINEGTYHENLTITKPITLTATGTVIIVPVDRSRPVIDVSSTSDVIIEGIHVEDAAVGIRAAQASCLLTNCRIQSTAVGVDVAAFEADDVRVEATTFAGQGVGIKTLGDGRIEIVDCTLRELATGVLIGGLTSVVVRNSAFADTFEGIVMAGSATATLSGNTIDGARLGIRVSDVPSGPKGTLNIDSNTIRNCTEGAISLCTDLATNDLAFTGKLSGAGNVVEGGIDALCPSWFAWPDGFLTAEHPAD